VASTPSRTASDVESPPTRASSARPRSLAFTAVALFLGTLAFRGARLGRPRTFVFDEVFYANDALDVFTHGVEQTFVGHPPLAKWLIAAGFLVGDFSPVTWRLSALVAGAIVVSLTFLIARRLTESTMFGLVAAILVLTDGIAHFVGRYALLDGFTTLFVLLAVGYLVRTRGRCTYGVAAMAGLLCGAALATKWSSGPVVVVALFAIFWRSRGIRLGRRVALLAVVVGLTMAGYGATYVPWIAAGSTSGNCTSERCDDGPLQRLALLPSLQKTMLDSQVGLDRGSSYQMEPGWRWFLQDKNISLYGERCKGQSDAVCSKDQRGLVTVVARGNTVLWIIWLPLTLWWLVQRRRRRVDAGSSIPLLLGAAIVLWAPWLVFSEAFPFYAAPIVPLIALGDVAMLRVLLPRRIQPLLLGAVALAAMLIFFVERHGPPWTG
jgi:dolichyl-phosphate-mannose-protein mannosyltransferase